MIKRLFFDIEVSPNIGMFWQPGHKISIGYENIIKERAIICICYKWQGQKTVHSLSWDKGNDKQLLKKFLKVANRSHELIGHNGDNFDLKWIRTRCLYHEVDMFPSYITIDTLKEARKGFRFNSNRLDYISQFVGLKGKIKTEFNLWREITLHNNQKALKTMVDYCKNDVVILEKTFARISKYIKPKSSITDDRGKCPECGGERLTIRYRYITATGVKKIGLQCKNCGKSHVVSENIFTKARSTPYYTRLTNAK